MAKRFYSEAELSELATRKPVMPQVGYSLGAPVPQVFVVTLDPELGASEPCVRTATMGRLSWTPYTKSLNIPLDDEPTVAHLAKAGAECVLALPTRNLLRQITICSLRVPPGISGARLARFKMVRSLFVDPPSIDDCPVNFECVVEHVEEYYTHLIAFVRVIGASINDKMLFLERDEITALFPTNDADAVVDDQGNRQRRVSLLTDLHLCPTFPVGPKIGWYGTFNIWIRDLVDEEYMGKDDYNIIAEWHDRWQELFPQLDAPERAQLRTNITEVARLCARERWQDLHAFVQRQKEAG